MESQRPAIFQTLAREHEQLLLLSKWFEARIRMENKCILAIKKCLETPFPVLWDDQHSLRMGLLDMMDALRQELNQREVSVISCSAKLDAFKRSLVGQVSDPGQLKQWDKEFKVCETRARKASQDTIFVKNLGVTTSSKKDEIKLANKTMRNTVVRLNVARARFNCNYDVWVDKYIIAHQESLECGRSMFLAFAQGTIARTYSYIHKAHDLQPLQDSARLEEALRSESAGAVRLEYQRYIELGQANKPSPYLAIFGYPLPSTDRKPDSIQELALSILQKLAQTRKSNRQVQDGKRSLTDLVRLVESSGTTFDPSQVTPLEASELIECYLESLPAPILRLDESIQQQIAYVSIEEDPEALFGILLELVRATFGRIQGEMLRAIFPPPRSTLLMSGEDHLVDSFITRSLWNPKISHLFQYGYPILYDIVKLVGMENIAFTPAPSSAYKDTIQQLIDDLGRYKDKARPLYVNVRSPKRYGVDLTPSPLGFHFDL